MNKENKYYVYGHYTVDGDRLFYIGKGCGSRHFTKSGRRNNWNEFVENNPWYSKLLIENLSNDQALLEEAKLVKMHRGSLINRNINTPVRDLNAISETLYYDESSPTFLRWKINATSGRNNSHIKKKAGDVAGSIYIGKYNTITCRIKSVAYVASRVIWYLHNGVYPTEGAVIDHIDGNSLNNNISNLRLCSQAVNAKNSAKRSDNSSGQVGIYFDMDSAGRSFCKGQITHDGVTKNVSFSLRKHGLLPAFAKVYKWRKEQLRLLNEQGAGYTDRHGT